MELWEQVDAKGQGALAREVHSDQDYALRALRASCAMVHEEVTKTRAHWSYSGLAGANPAFWDYPNRQPPLVLLRILYLGGWLYISLISHSCMHRQVARAAVIQRRTKRRPRPVRRIVATPGRMRAKPQRPGVVDRHR